MKKFAAVAFLLAIPAFAQTRPYYITNGDGTTGYIVQGGAVQSTFTIHGLGYPIAVGDSLRISHRDYQDGAEYTLSGTPTGVVYDGTGGFSELLDGGTDGVQYNYSGEWSGGRVIRTDLNWQAPTVLFSGVSDLYGLTYDTASGHLWIYEDGGDVTEYTLAGAEVSSFTPAGPMNGLAYDEVADTLWGYDQNGTLRNYSKAGVLLDTVDVGQGFGNAYGGEMAIQGSRLPATDVPVTSPSGLALLATVLALAGAAALKLRG